MRRTRILGMHARGADPDRSDRCHLAQHAAAQPEAWDEDRIEAKRRELGPVEFARQMLCQARNDSTSSFKEADINEAVRRGNGFERIHSLPDFPGGACPDGSEIFIGVDPSFCKVRTIVIADQPPSLPPSGTLSARPTKSEGPAAIDRNQSWLQRLDTWFVSDLKTLLAKTSRR